MAQCTAPIQGHRTASGRANCPVCGGRSRQYTPYISSYSGLTSSWTPAYQSPAYHAGGSSRSNRPYWSTSSSSVIYTAGEIRALSPIRRSIEKQGLKPDKYDVFLCHAWDDRRTVAKDLYEALKNAGVSVWFSEREVLLGSNLMREIDRGLAKSRAGLVLVTASFIGRIKSEGVADKELSALLARDLLVPIVHGVTYEDLREESPLLASRNGLSTAEDTVEDIAAKISELVSTDELSD
ncbi:toll/interleukin-1 receptor domain-containing protein [Bifidobacterium pseudolongum]|uniref:TIR domain-containing protein n=1 Tax=Bifidobacterium pseudolongum subsp. globosum TaxID=1690 RepID=A0A8B3RNY0_9BIFI|nr:toll/interleukin-1 receptor domain-containing protein [Bifidobacterium pseudolongum]RYQ46811.1 TIR domain-containing protein [Bifidobacterium pseudolongum subsp. globosum]